MQELKVLDKEKVGMFEFTGIEGGFGDGKKSMLVKDIAEIHESTVGAINQAINMNRKRFKDSIDIINLRDTNFAINLIDSGFSQNQINASKYIYLLSERGYAKLLKILEDDTAWEIYDELVDNYFNMRSDNLRMPETPVEIMAVVGQITAKQDQAIKLLDNKVTYLTDLAGLNSARNKELTKARNKRVIERCGGVGTNAYKDTALRKKVYHQMFQDYKECFGVNQYADTPMKRFEEAKEFIENWHERYPLEQEIKRTNEQTNLDI